MTETSRRSARVRSTRWRSPRWFWIALLAASALGGAIRVAMVEVVDQPEQPGFLVDYDPIFYHRQANLVADGRGFLAPYVLDEAGRGPERPSAGHPPLLVVALALASKLGLRSFHAHRLVVALLGAGLVPLAGLLAAKLAGARAGVIAAVIVAVYPNFWLYDALLMPEVLAGLLVAATLLVAYHLLSPRASPDDVATGPPAGGPVTHQGWWGALLGALIGLAALTRGELALLLLLVAAPVVWVAARARTSWRDAVRLGAVVVVASGLVVAPWVVYNLTRFERPVFVSTAVDTTFAGANCDPAFHGEKIGGWADACFADILARGEEESVAASHMRSRAVSYVRDHKKRLPLVALARVGRQWDVFKPADNVAVGELQRRPRIWSWIGLACYAVLVPFAVAGFVVLRRRRVPIFPLLAMPVLVTLTALMFYGNPRFRRPAELVIVVAASVTIEALSSRRAVA